MGMRVTFDDLWQHLESLTDAEVDAVYEAALADTGYRISLGCLFVAWGGCLAACSFAVPAFYRAFHPGLLIKSAIVLVTLLAVFLSIRAAFAINQQLYKRAVMRQIVKRTRILDGT